MTDSEPVTNIKKSLKEWKDELDGIREELTFTEYLEKVVQTPSIAALAHERIYNMIMSHGQDAEGRYSFFKDHLYGVDEAVRSVVEYFKSSALRMETRKRIFLLQGPVSSAKSTLVDLLKKGLEDYSRTDIGAIYGIKGCPMHEEPLHLIPGDMRKHIMERYGVYIEGELCPVCRYRLDEEFQGDFERFQVERVFISEQGRVGIGTFLPSDPKSQDISELVGSINFAKIGEVGTESNPLAFTFDGELNIANRGMMEFIEMLKADEKFLYVLLTLSQEQVLKAPRFPRIHCDVVIIAHTNESEYIEFINDPKSEALQDRIIRVDFPYNLKLDQEKRIYDKLLAGAPHKKHIAPHTIEAASMLAILSRITPSPNPNVDIIKKMRLYNGDAVPGFSASDLEHMREEAPREGLEGISPRFIVNTMAKALIQDDDSECVTPVQLLRLLRKEVQYYSKFSEDEKKSYTSLITVVTDIYESIAERAVRGAVVESLEEACDDLFDTYIQNVRAYVEGASMTDDFDNEVPPDDSLMRSIEKRLGVPESGKETYRGQILAKVGTYAVKGEKFTYSSDENLKSIITDLVYEQNKGQIQAITTVKKPNEELQRRISQVLQRLMDEKHYCLTCANELLRFVGAIFSKEAAEQKKAAEGKPEET